MTLPSSATDTAMPPSASASTLNVSNSCGALCFLQAMATGGRGKALKRNRLHSKRRVKRHQEQKNVRGQEAVALLLRRWKEVSKVAWIRQKKEKGNHNRLDKHMNRDNRFKQAVSSFVDAGFVFSSALALELFFLQSGVPTRAVFVMSSIV